MFGINGNNDTNGSPTQPGSPAMPEPQSAPMATMPDPIASTPTAPPIPDAPAAPDPIASANPPELTLLPPTEPPKIELKGAPVNKSSAPSSTAPVIEEHKDELIDLKKQALQNLAPLVGHLDQTPEEKFKTTMMMLQASDNSELVKDAFEAANHITDDKARAQALLDVVNEINYFTQHNTASGKSPAANPS